MNIAHGESRNELLYLGFNQDNGCFATGTTEGFAVYNVSPFRETFRRIFTTGGIGIVEMLFRCNLLALVGGGQNPRYPPNKVMIWDDNRNKCVGELMFKNEVCAVRLRRDRVIVALKTRVFVYRFKDLKLLTQIPTIANERGLLAQSQDPSTNVLAIPGTEEGTVRVDLFDIGKFTTIKAHESALAQLCLSFDGSRLATASDKGTIIRLWDTTSGAMLREFRRGSDRAEIYSLAINHDATLLACSSDKGTVHVFSLRDPSSHAHANSQDAQMFGQTSPGVNVRGTPQRGANSSGLNSSSKSSSPFSMGMNVLSSILPEAVVPKYFASEWSFAQIRGIEGRSICAFDQSGSISGSSSSEERIVVLSAEGIFTMCSVKDTDCPRIAVNNFLRDTDDSRYAVDAGHVQGQQRAAMSSDRSIGEGRKAGGASVAAGRGEKL